MIWNTLDDSLSPKFPNLSDIVFNSKRDVLSIIGRVFDPLGILSPIIIVAKLIFQDCWKGKLGWDDELPLSLKKDFQSFVDCLRFNEGVSVPRFYGFSPSTVVELHCFCDASVKAISACIYARFFHEGEFCVSFVCGRARVSPMNPTSIPRLELLACVLLSSLYQDVISSFPNHHAFFYSDSVTCIFWIRNHTKKLKSWVNSRVSVVRRVCQCSRWFHVPSECNIADLGSRGCTSGDQLSMWLHGPEFLYHEFKPETLSSVEIQTME